MYSSEQLGNFHATCKSVKKVTNLGKMRQKPTIAQIVVLIPISHCSENCVHCLLFLENSLQELKKEMYSSALQHIQEFHLYPVTLFIWEHAVNQQDRAHFRNMAKQDSVLPMTKKKIKINKFKEACIYFSIDLYSCFYNTVKI